jgi:hypothetical protein
VSEGTAVRVLRARLVLREDLLTASVEVSGGSIHCGVVDASMGFLSKLKI